MSGRPTVALGLAGWKTSHFPMRHLPVQKAVDLSSREGRAAVRELLLDLLLAMNRGLHREEMKTVMEGASLFAVRHATRDGGH